MINNDEKRVDMNEHLGTLKIPYVLMADVSFLKNQLNISYHGLAILSGVSMSTLKRLNSFAYTGEPNDLSLIHI